MAAPKVKCLVLGGTGFIGRALVHMLVGSGQCAVVRSVDKVFPQTAFLSKEHAAVYDSPLCHFMQGNLSSEASIAKCFQLEDHSFDYVFSCAAESKYGLDDPIYQEKTHDVVMKIAREAAKHPEIKKFVHLSTAQVYKADKKASKEGSSLDPWTMLAKSHRKTEEDLRGVAGLPLVILRPATVYGPGDILGIAPRLICAAVYKHLGEKMKFLWTGDLRVNTVHVLDVCRAMWHAANTLPAGSLFNLADKNDTDQEKICSYLEALFGIQTGFLGSIISNMAKLNLRGMAEDVNDKHLKPWSEMCKAAGIQSTPLTPYLDPELLYNNSLCVDGSAIEATGFNYQFPNVTVDLLREQIRYHIDQHLFPMVL